VSGAWKWAYIYIYIGLGVKEGVESSETLVFYHSTKWHHNPKEFNLNLCHCKKLKSWFDSGLKIWDTS